MARLRILVPLLSILGLFALLVKRLADFGVFTPKQSFNTESCRVIANFSSCEDIQVDYANDLLYLSANNWTAYFREEYSVQGGIYVLDLKQKNAKPKLVSVDQPAVFHPHGFHLYTDPETKEKVLFVINHKQKGHSAIEVFDVIDKDTIKHRETFSHDLLINANEVLGVGKRQFYVTQDTKYPLNGITLTVAAALGREAGSLFHFDGKNWKTVIENLNLGNGLAVSPDHKLLFVGETNKKRVRIYDGDIKSGDIRFKASYNLDLFPDNIEMDSDGNLWAAGFPNLLAMSERIKGRDLKVPVRIMKASFEGEKLKDLTKMLETTGEEFMAQTVVVPYQDKMILAGIFTPEVRMCNVPKDAPRSEIHFDTDL